MSQQARASQLDDHPLRYPPPQSGTSITHTPSPQRPQQRPGCPHPSWPCRPACCSTWPSQIHNSYELLLAALLAVGRRSLPVGPRGQQTIILTATSRHSPQCQRPTANGEQHPGPRVSSSRQHLLLQQQQQHRPLIPPIPSPGQSRGTPCDSGIAPSPPPSPPIPGKGKAQKD